LLVDWELERSRSLDLQVAREAIRVEDVFDHIHRAAKDNGWGRHFNGYQEAVKLRGQAEDKVVKVLARETGESRYAPVRDLGAEVIAALVRRGAGVSGRWQEPLAKATSAVVQGGAEQLALVNEWLKARVRLKPNEESLYREPNDNLARALGQGLAAVARDTPLLVMLDTYEIVARADPWMRSVVKTAGARVMWVIAGRDNLASSRPAARYVGYSGEFPRRLTAWDVQELAIDYVAEYLHDRAPERPVTREQAQALHRATLGVPLALKHAADLWASGVPLRAITEGIPDRAPRDEIVKLMSQRILIHCDDPAHRRALYLLAMQRRPDASVQTAVLRPDQGPFDLMAHLDKLAACYSSIRVTGGAHLHGASAAFMREYLLTPELRAGDEVKTVAARANAAARARQAALEQDLIRLEDRCESDDWQEAVLDTIHWLLWHDEVTAWRELMPRLIEGLGYQPRLAGSLLEVIAAFETALSNDGRKRLKALQRGMSDKATVDDADATLSELERWLKQHDTHDTYAAERATPKL
jgi:hypothetical protein